MKTAIYKLTSPKIGGGGIYLSYREGQLRTLDLADAHPTAAQLLYLLQHLPADEAALAAAPLGSMTVAQLSERSAKDKIVLFCVAFKDYRGIPYHATQNERSNIRTVPVSRDLLKVFFEDDLVDFSIRNYIHRINVTRDKLKNSGAQKFPDYYDKALYNKLPPDQLMAYKKHLVDKGWVFDRVRGWVEKSKL
jgi:hypothetical protein